MGGHGRTEPVPAVLGWQGGMAVPVRRRGTHHPTAGIQEIPLPGVLLGTGEKRDCRPVPGSA